MAKTRHRKKSNTTIKGKKLEIYVEQLFKDLGKWFVKRDVYYSFRSLLQGKVVRRAQVDVQYYDMYGKTIVECKYYDAWRVSAQDVKSFQRKVGLIKPSYALIITNNSLTKEAEELAESFGIKVYDGDALQMLDDQRMGLFRMRIRDQSKKRKTLEQQLQEINLSRYDLEEHYTVRRYVLF